MKIVSLTMNAFLAYKEKTVIDFENLANCGLYLISGPTGSGKTTIFDAITFALYGVASGSQRNASYFRSDYADVKEETYVEMVFRHHGKEYTIKRTPTYMRPGYKTAKMATAYLSYDHVTIEGIKEVNQKIVDLLGVDVHQFKQIVMIAQGEFTKLIYASSEEREKVLRHIFHSDSLVAFENILKEKTKEYKEQYFLSQQQLTSRFQLLSFSEDFMHQYKEGFHPQYIEDAKQENQKVSHSLQEANLKYLEHKKTYDQFSQAYLQKQKHNEDIQNYQLLQKQYTSLLEQEDQMKVISQNIEKLKMIEKNQVLIQSYQNCQDEVNNLHLKITNAQEDEVKLQNEFQKAKTMYETLPKLHQQKEQLILKIEKLNQALQKQNEKNKLSKEHEKIVKVHNNQYEQYQLSWDKHLKLQKRMERDQDNVDKLSSLQLELQQNEQIVKDINQKRVSIHNLSEWYDQYTQFQDRHYELSEKYKQIDFIYQQLREEYRQEDENYKRQQAGILAIDLKEGDPCPVCGSLHHPQLATLSKRVLTSKELEELNHKVENQKDKKEEAYQDVLSQNEQMNALKGRIDILKNQLDIQEELSKEVFIRLLSNITQVIQEQEKNYQKRYNQVAYLKKIKKSLEQDQKAYDLETDKLEKWLIELHEQENKMTVLQTKLEQFEKEFPFNESMEEDILQLKQELLQLNKQIDHIDSHYHQSQKNLSVIQNQYQLLQKQWNDKSLELEELKTQFHKMIDQHFQTLENYEHYYSQLSKLDTMDKKYHDYFLKKQTLFAQLEAYRENVKNGELYDLTQEKEKLVELEKVSDQLFEKYHTLEHQYQQNQKIIKKMELEYHKNQDVFEKYTLYQDLYDMASGKNGQRMSFERYVLSTYFEHILEYANAELLKMSQGRFALFRKQEIKGTKQQGLDLSVLDYETGMMRDIRSLSGGESFKAALALALGLSSMIQSYAGGIELNTLFIDEGFGSLDSESIDQALSVLLDLKNDNKVIGIISHVDELKERIPTQIVVEKGKNGSRLHIEKE